MVKQKRTAFFLLSVLFAFLLFFFYSKKTVVFELYSENVVVANKDIEHVSKSMRVDESKLLTDTAEIVPQKKAVSLKNVADGFSNFAHNYTQKTQNNHCELSISETRFLEKMIQAVGTMCNIYRNKLVAYIHERTMLHCAVSLLKNGLLEQCTISKTSGNIMLDSLIKQIVSEAGVSFPPLPQSITKIPYYLIFQFDFQGGLTFTVLLPR